MCTVTFLPVKNKCFITSNRDEKQSRKHALPPAVHYHKGSKLLFPKDADAGGTWVALNANGNAAVLLNGAFENHVRQNYYMQSRGKILLDVIAEERPVRFFTKTDLKFIEPFTLIIWEKNCLYECRWDGVAKYCVQLRRHIHHIWSSATLYSPSIRKKREQWLAKFLNNNPTPGVDDILHFHATGGDGDNENDLRMNRHGLYSTVSITAIELDEMSGRMIYKDCKDDSEHQTEIEFISDYMVDQTFLHENN